MGEEGLHLWMDRFEDSSLQVIQDHGELFKGCVEVVEMADNIELDLDKSCFEYSLLFICILFVICEGQDCRAFGFGYMGMNMVVMGGLLPNFVGNDECIDAIFLLDDEIFVVDEAFLQYIEEGGEFLV